MIRVNKSSKLIPASFPAKAAIEKAHNLAAIKAGRLESLSFKMYKDKELDAVLKKIFNNKCAYCEAKASFAAPWDVEHFRPKSKTFKKGQKKIGYIGYYWLAADWDNLLLSCQYCNRPNKHYVPGKTDMITIGKHEQFPLDNEAMRWLKIHSKKQFGSEEDVRLLVHPCKEYPETFFEFIITGKDAGGIKAKSTVAGFKLRKAEQSIVTYALHRMGLVNERANRVRNVEFIMLVIDREIKAYYRASARDRLTISNNIGEYLDRLVTMTEIDQQFSALAKQIIIPFLSSIRPLLKGVVKRKF